MKFSRAVFVALSKDSLAPDGVDSVLTQGKNGDVNLLFEGCSSPSDPALWGHLSSSKEMVWD